MKKNEISEKYKKYGDLFFKSGKPKKKYMMCYDREYLQELRAFNSPCLVYPGHTCAGNRCPYYGIGCPK